MRTPEAHATLKAMLRKAVAFILVAILSFSNVLGVMPGRVVIGNSTRLYGGQYDSLHYDSGWGYLGHDMPHYTPTPLPPDSTLPATGHELDSALFAPFSLHNLSIEEPCYFEQARYQFELLWQSDRKFCTLTTQELHLIFSQLDIANTTQAKNLLYTMAQDGFNVGESISILSIIKTGLFTYQQGQILAASQHWQYHIAYFQQFAQMFDIAYGVNQHRLVSVPFAATNNFYGAYQAVAQFSQQDIAHEVATHSAFAVSFMVDYPEYEYYEGLDIATIAMRFANIENMRQELDGNLTIDFELLLASIQNATMQGLMRFNHGLPWQMVDVNAVAMHYSSQQLANYTPQIVAQPEPDVPLATMPPLSPPIVTSPGAINVTVYSGQPLYAGSLATAPALQLGTASPATVSALPITTGLTAPSFLPGQVAHSATTAPAISIAVQQPQLTIYQTGQAFAGYTSAAAFDVAVAMFLAGYTPTDIHHAFALGTALGTSPMCAMAIVDALAIPAQDVQAIAGYGAAIMAFGGIAPMASTHQAIVTNAFSFQFNANDSVSLNTGAAIFRERIVTMPGRNGHGFALDLVYNSARADFNRPSTVNCSVTWEFGCRDCWSHGSTRQFNRSHRIICQYTWMAHGWAFDLPYVTNYVVNIPGRGSYPRHLIPAYMTLFVGGAPPGRLPLRYYTVTLYDGTRYQFNNLGQIVYIQDRFGNTTHFEYAVTFSRSMLARIIDSSGGVTRITYYQQSTGRSIRVVDPAGGVFTINKRLTFENHGFRVTDIVNQVGAVTTFTYEIRNYTFNILTREMNLNAPITQFGRPPAIGQTLLLTQVTYPSGAQLRFQYNVHRAAIGVGIREVWKVSTRELVSNNRVYNRTTFAYRSGPTAYPNGRNGAVPNSHTYSVTVTQNNGRRTEYTFNNNHLNISQVTQDSRGTVLWRRDFVYNAQRLPTTITLVETNGSYSRTTTQRFTYNANGQILTSVRPVANGSNNQRYVITNTYDSRFGLPLTTAFNTDNSTRVEERHTLSSDGRSITRTEIFENGTRVSRTDFRHDRYGNVTEVREFPNANSSTFIATQIEFDRGTMPRVVRNTNVQYVSGGLVGGTGIIERRFTYDALWRVLTETDPMGYTTTWRYDRIGRITRIDFPNGGHITYTYNNQLNTIVYRNILGGRYTYQMDGFGNLLTITCPGGNVILRNVYDNRMRITSTFNAPGATSSTERRFWYDIFDRVTREEVLRPVAGSGAYSRTLTEYFDVFDASGNRRVVTTVVGNNTASPSIQTFVQYDRAGRRTQEGTIGGRIFTYNFDLSGRVTRERTLGVDNRFTHNIFGITSVTNIQGNVSNNRYDSMGRVTHTSDFMGNYQRFTYDAIGRLIRTRTPFATVNGATVYADSRYYFDNNGNLREQFPF